MQKAAFEALQVKKDLMHRQIRKQVGAVGGAPASPFLCAFLDSIGGSFPCWLSEWTSPDVTFPTT